MAVVFLVQAKFSFHDGRELTGTFVNGVMTEGMIIYGESGTVDRSELEYKV